MITMQSDTGNKNVENLLNLDTLEYGDEYLLFAKTSQITMKTTAEGDTFLKIILKDYKGRRITGRLFGDLTPYADWPKFSNTICIIKFRVDYVFGKFGLNISQIILPPAEDIKHIASDLFDSKLSTLPNITSAVMDYVTQLPAENQKTLLELVKLNNFHEMQFRSDDNVLAGKQGYQVVLLQSVWQNILSLQLTTESLTEDLCEILMSSYLISELVLCETVGNINHASDVFLKVQKLLLVLRVTDNTSYINCIYGYLNLRLNINSPTTSATGELLFNLHQSAYTNLKLLDSLNSPYEKTSLSDNRIILNR